MNIKEMVQKAREAQAEYALNFDQDTVDMIVKTVGKTVYDNAEMLADMAVKETRMGVYEDKIAKNKGKSKAIWHDIKGKKSMGILSICDRTGMIEIAKPIGVVAGITPTTNPIVTPMSKIMFSLKTKNAIIIAPHPRSKKCSNETVRLIKENLKKFNVPENLIQCIEEPSIEKTAELMKEADVVVATGGMAMVRSAYSSGKPSFGVGAGNVQVILDRHIDYPLAASKVIAGRVFDNGIICSGEQSFIYPKEDRDAVMKAFEQHGAYIVPMAEKQKVVNAIFEDGHLAPDIVGQSPKFIADKAGITIPEKTRVLVLESEGYGDKDIISKEKMCPVLSAYPYDHFEEAILIAKTNLNLEGSGHTAAIHSNDQGNIIKAGSELCVSRFVVNAPSATTAGGSIQNGLAVTNTLGCGSWGNNSISENFTYKHLLNITRIAPISAKIPVPTDEEIWA
ncbi:MAG: aldehyde dehydrogenase family protein [Peptostreptococcaceae bacterium]|nr:aldehyde dehydrogenase family protein [Peptostreptococcaceae bacterium]